MNLFTRLAAAARATLAHVHLFRSFDEKAVLALRHAEEAAYAEAAALRLWWRTKFGGALHAAALTEQHALDEYDRIVHVELPALIVRLEQAALARLASRK